MTFYISKVSQLFEKAHWFAYIVLVNFRATIYGRHIKLYNQLAIALFEP
jgi:uncharacterized membrane protein YiaA